MRAALADLEAALPGLLDHNEPDNPGMHTTVTIDFEYVLSGRVVVELDDGATVELGPGDTVVQNGAGASGVIIAQGGRFGGWCIHVQDGRARFAYNVLGIQEFATEATEPIPAGTHQVRMEFAYDGGGLAKGGDVTLYYDGQAVGTGRVGATQPMVFSADETTDIGYESGTTVTPAYTPQTSRFTGKIKWVQIDLGDDDHDHFIDPEERLRVAMAKQ